MQARNAKASLKRRPNDGTQMPKARLPSGSRNFCSPRLAVDLVPASMWGRNVRAVVATDTWDALRWKFGATLQEPLRLTIDSQANQCRNSLACAICSGVHRALDLHEEWQYDDIQRIQRLVGLIAVCKKCHLAKHLGCANAIGRAEEALTHLVKINGWSRRTAEAYREQVFDVWERRSTYQYSLDLTFLAQHIPASKIHLDWLENPRTWIGSRLDAIIWANRLLESDALILDTETTGLIRENSNVEVIELAVINTKGRVIYQSLFRPIQPIPRRVVSIHGIKNADVRIAVTFADEFARIQKALNGSMVVSFNAKFDRDVIANTCFLHGQDSPSIRWECAMRAYRTFSGSGRYLSLPGKSHRALPDARSTLKLLRRMARAEI